MITADAVNKVLQEKGLSKYRMAMDMGAAPPSVYQWAKGTKMSPYYASKFEELYGIGISDETVRPPNRVSG